MEYYNYIKSLHLIFVITWFAGLFYQPRLFIYHIEASKKESPEKEILEKQLKLMARRLWYIITWPSAILASYVCSMVADSYAKLAFSVVDAHQTRVCFIVDFISFQNASNVFTAPKRRHKLFFKFHEVME